MANNNNTITKVGLDLNTESAEQKIERLNQEFKELKKLQKDLSKDPIMNASQLKQVDKELAGIRNEMTKSKKETIDVRKVMNNISGVSLRELQMAYRKVADARSKMAQSDPKFKQHESDLKRIKAQIDKNNISYKEQNSLMSRLTGGFSKYSGIVMAAMASMAGVAFTVKQSIDAYLQLDEKMADVMKTTGLTKAEVIGLNQELAKIDTRTAQQDLLDLARVAGKLGITAEAEILGFVKAADQIAVALAEDLGGNVEESVNQIGKLVEIFGIKDEFGMEQSLLKIGSTINSLGAIGTANEGYMVEFAKRVGGIAPMAGITIDQIMGLGATLDELGQTAEVSGTTLTDVIGSMFKDTAGFAEIARMSMDDFSNLLNTDANEAFIKVLEGAKGTSGGFQELALNLDALGIDGNRSIGVLSVLANNIDLVRERQSYANEEFSKGTSLTDEFNVKNNTATAQLEKSKKQFLEMSIVLGQKLQPAYAGIVSKASLMLKGIMGIIDIMIKYRNVLIPATTALVTYYIAIKAADLWSKTLIARTNALRIAKLLYGTSVKILTGQLKLATAAKKAFDMVGKTNVWALAAAAVTAAAAAIIIYVKNMDKTAKLQKEINEAMKQASEELGAQKSELQGLLSTVRDSTISLEKRKEAMQKINAISPEYLGNLSLETINTEEATQAIVAYTAVLEQKAKAQALSTLIAQKYVDVENLKTEHASDAKIQQAENDKKILEERLTAVNKEIERLMREAEMANNVAGSRDLIGTSQIGVPEGTEALNYDGTPIIYKNGKWQAKNVPPPSNQNNSNTGGSGGGTGSTSVNEEAEKLNQEIWEMAQFQDSMLLDAGEFYAEYLLNRSSQDQSYYKWKKANDKSERDLEFKSMLEALEDATKNENLALQERYATGKIDKAQYEAEKGLIVLASLENEYALRVKYAQDINDIEQQIVDRKAELLRQSYDQQVKITEKLKGIRIDETEKEKEELKKRRDHYIEIAAEMGESVGRIMGDTSKSIEERRKAVAKSMLILAVKELRNMLAIAIAEAMAKEVGTKGYIGLITGAGLTAALGTAYGLAMSKLEGYQSGGYTGGKNPTKVAGFVHEDEYVVPQAGTRNPSLSRVLRVVEAARQTNKLSTLDFETLFQMPGMQSGGYAGNNKSSGAASISNNPISFPTEFFSVLQQLSNKLDKLDNIEANISYDKLTISQERITGAQNKARLKS